MWRRIFGGGEAKNLQKETSRRSPGEAAASSSAPEADEDLDDLPFDPDEDPDFGPEAEGAEDQGDAVDVDAEPAETDEAPPVQVRVLDAGPFALQPAEAMPSYEDVASLGREEYELLVGELPMPRKRQMRDFAAYVAGAKDWHELLPLLPDGAVFRFYLDPFAGMDRILMPDSRAAFVPRAADADGFLPAWIPTAEYRERFGCLAFACAEGSRFVKPVKVETDAVSFEGVLDNNFNHAVVWVPRKPFGLPDPIVRAGTCFLTGVVHAGASHPAAWRTTLAATKTNHAWPAETGGATTLAQIRARCEAAGMADEFDPELDALLAPERQRLLDEMVAAMTRVLGQIHGHI
jgi:hypothetical protein